MKVFWFMFYFSMETENIPNRHICKAYLFQSDFFNFRSEKKAIWLEAVVCRCSKKLIFLKIRKIHRKTPVVESLFSFPIKLETGNTDQILLLDCIHVSFKKFFSAATKEWHTPDRTWDTESHKTLKNLSKIASQDHRKIVFTTAIAQTF